MDNVETFITKLETRLDQLGDKLNAWTAKADDVGADAKRKLVAELREKHRGARSKLDELKAAGGEKWETFKGGVESAYDELEATYQKLIRN